MASAPIHAFLKFFLPALCTVVFPSHWLLYHTTIVETISSHKRKMNPDYHQPSELILAQAAIEPKILCSEVMYATN